MKYLLAITLLTGCIRDDLVDCGGGTACPAGTACANIDDEIYCVSPDDLTACIDHHQFEECELAEGTDEGACYDAEPSPVCLPAGCGNGLLDPGEVCDDENGVVGDGCSSNCLSDETCGNGTVDPVAGEQCDDGDAVGHDGCNSTCSPEAAGWEQLVFGLPDPVAQQGAAYDSARRRVVVFGGQYQQQNGLPVPHDQTWEWDGVGWMRPSTPISPSARFGAAMAYDPVRKKTVLFGGAASGVAVGADTWEWDGGTWMFRSVATIAPPARYGAAFAFDPEHDSLLLFGGHDGKMPLGDLWEWNGTAWAQLPDPGIRPRSNGVLIYDPVRGVMMLAGGADSGGTGDTWERRSGVWTQAGPARADLATASFAFDGRRMIAFGGRLNGTSTADTMTWDGSKWVVLVPFSTGGGTPGGREQAALVRDPINNRVVLSGGRFTSAACMSCTSTSNMDSWRWNPETLTWDRISAQAPIGRAFHAAAYDSRRGKLVVFGGFALSSGTLPGDTWELSDGHWSLMSSTGTVPAPRTRAAMAFDAARGEVVMFGGENQAGQRIAETWLWNGTRWQPSTAPAPQPRYGAAMAYDVARKRVVLFGGLATSTFADTWEWDGAAWTQVLPTQSPPSRSAAALAYDPSRRRVVMVGGEDLAGSFADTWEFDGTTWTPIENVQSPPARASAAIAWNGARSTLTLFAGANLVFAQLEDTWELAGTTWTQQFMPTRPGFRQAHSLTPAPDGTGVIVFGGMSNNGQGSAETWRLRWSAPVPYERCVIAEDADGDGLAGCADPDCWSRCTPLCPPGTTCDPSFPRCGDGVCNAALEDCRLCPGDCTCAPICGDAFCDPGEACPGDC